MTDQIQNTNTGIPNEYFYESTLAILKWLEEHRYLFGKTVYDLFCKKGEITCCLAMLNLKTHGCRKEEDYGKGSKCKGKNIC